MCVYMLKNMQTPHREYLLRVSYLEIYNESINDLFDPHNTNLKLLDDPPVRIQIILNNNTCQGLDAVLFLCPL